MSGSWRPHGRELLKSGLGIGFTEWYYSLYLLKLEVDGKECCCLFLFPVKLFWIPQLVKLAFTVVRRTNIVCLVHPSPQHPVLVVPARISVNVCLALKEIHMKEAHVLVSKWSCLIYFHWVTMVKDRLILLTDNVHMGIICNVMLLLTLWNKHHCLQNFLLGAHCY